MAMWKALVFATLISAQQAQAEIPCPVRLISGDADQDGIRLSFMNKGKVPIQQLSLACTSNQAARRGICHTESGIFYPGMKYSIDFAYPGVRPALVIAIEAARLAGGEMWTTTSPDSCRELKILRKKKTS